MADQKPELNADDVAHLLALQRKSAAPADPVERPTRWDKAVSVAYLRLLGASQKAAAREAGVGERTLRVWEQCSWWAVALAEARQRWLKGGDAAAMRGLTKALNSEDEYAATARWWADRRIRELRPPSVKLEGGPEDGPTAIVIYHPEKDPP